MTLREQGKHLLDLDDLLCGAAEEAQQGFTEWLAKDAQPGKRSEAGSEVGVAAQPGRGHTGTVGQWPRAQR